MATKVNKPITSSRTRFSAAPMAEIEFSTLLDNPRLLTTCNAGDIVPVYCAEVLPHDTFDIGLDFVTRQTTMLCPVMDGLVQDFYAFFVPNRVINKSWKNVMGENTSGAWSASEVSLSPLYVLKTGEPANRKIRVPIGSIADYYGFPTQSGLDTSLLAQCHDLKFRGYLEIYNNYFRNQNYQPPIAYSKLNVYNGFFEDISSNVSMIGDGVGTLTDSVFIGTNSDGSFEKGGAVVKELFGEGSTALTTVSGLRHTTFSALNPPLKANKMLDYFTSVLPSPQKGRQVEVPIAGQIPFVANASAYEIDGAVPNGVKFGGLSLGTYYNGALTTKNNGVLYVDQNTSITDGALASVGSTNLIADLNASGIAVSVNDLRMSSAMQRVYEILGNGGSRYTEFVNSFFGIEVDNPYEDIPTLLGHFRRDLDMYQTAQTSASPSADDVGTPQGNLAAFGYTNKDGRLFTKTFNEHGYVHIFSVIRHRNSYSSMLSRDNFRLNMLDFYTYPLANIGEQPVYTREINPFVEDLTSVFGYQEAWAEYRYEPDRVSGYMRSGINETLDYWNYVDPFDNALVYANNNWLKSNTQDVVARSTASHDLDLPQFKLAVQFHIKKERPLPVYSVPGADIF